MSTIGHQVVFSLGRWASQIPTGFHVSRGTRVPEQRQLMTADRAITFYGRTFQTVELINCLVTLCSHCNDYYLVPRPLRCNVCRLTQRRFRLVPVRSPLLGESLLFSFPPGTEMFQFPGLAPYTYVFSARWSAFTDAGFPIRTSSDYSLCSNSPKLFAATNVLHRLLVPRHPPYALSSLTSSF